MFSKVTSRFSIAVIIIVLVVSSTVVCLAYFNKTSNKAINTLSLGEISCEISEDFNGVVKENVKIKNTGGTSAYIRAEVVVNWSSEDGSSVLSEKPVIGEDYTMDIDENNWFLGDDGFYYHKNDVLPEGYTNVLINEANLKDGVNPPEGYKLSIEVISSAIQSNPSEAVNEAWVVVNGENGVLSEL